MGLEFIAGENVEGLPLSEAVRAGDFIFVSGMVGFGPDGKVVQGGVAAETERIMGDLEELLTRAGGSLSRIVKVSVYLANADDFETFNRTYARYFKSKAPARVSVVTALTIDATVEMDFVVYT